MIGSKCHCGRSELGRNVQAAFFPGYGVTISYIISHISIVPQKLSQLKNNFLPFKKEMRLLYTVKMLLQIPDVVGGRSPQHPKTGVFCEYFIYFYDCICIFYYLTNLQKAAPSTAQ
jgi:hypothetical protein